MRLFIRFILISIILSSCTKDGSYRIYKTEYPAELKNESACRTSQVFPANKKAELENALVVSTASAFKKLKIKTNSKIGKSTFEISKNEFTITDLCATSDKIAAPKIKLRQLIELKNIGSGEKIQFLTDTFLQIHQTIVDKKASDTDYQPYLSALTIQNMIKAKEFLLKK